MIGTTVAALALAVLGGPAPTPGSTSGYGSAPRPGAEPAARLILGYAAESGYAASVKLTCGPAGGGHPKPVETCRTLRRTAVNPDRLGAGTGACTFIHAPVTATVTGTWAGRTIDWTHRYGNTCEMRRATGILFDF